MRPFLMRLPTIVLAGLLGSGVLPAQPTTPKEQVPPDTPPDVKALIERLYDPDAQRRCEAIWGLARLGEKAAPAIPLLVQLLGDPGECIMAPPVGTPRRLYVSQEAAEALRQMGEAAAAPLAEAMKHANPAIRLRAARLLAERGAAGARDVLAAALADPDAAVRWHAAVLLADLGDRRATPALVGFLKDEKRAWEAVRVLGDLRDPAAVEPLAAAYRGAGEEVFLRQHLLRTLGRIGRRPADVAPLVDALRSPVKDLRAEAAVALGQMQVAEAVPVLLEVLAGEESAYVRGCFVSALGHVGGKEAVDPLVKVLKGDGDQDVRMWAAEALGRIGDSRALEPLLAALGDTGPHVRAAAAQALGALKEARAVEPLVLLLRDRYPGPTEAAMLALVAIGPPAVEALANALADESAKARAWAAEALGRIRDRRAVEPLIAALEKAYEAKEGFVAERAAAALKHITGQDLGQDPAAWRLWWDARPRQGAGVKGAPGVFTGG